MAAASSSRFSAARTLSRSTESSTHFTRSNGWSSTSNWPDSIFEKSRMSLMIVSSASEESRIVSTKSAVSRSRSFCSSRLVIPTMAFIGVRISWLMLARKSFLARLAASAATTISFSLVMSIEAPMSRDGLPSTNWTCAVLRRHRITPGSGTMRNSTEYGSPVANARSEPLASSQRSSGCTISRTSSTCLPTLASDTRSSAAQASDPLTMPVARSISQIPKDAAISASRIRSALRFSLSSASFSAVMSMTAPPTR